MVLIKQHVSAYLEAIIRFTNVGCRRPNIHCGAVWLDVEISSSKVYRILHIHIPGYYYLRTAPKPRQRTNRT